MRLGGRADECVGETQPSISRNNQARATCQSVFTVAVDPTPAWISVPGLLIFASLTLVLAGWRAHHMDVSYGGD